MTTTTKSEVNVYVEKWWKALNESKAHLKNEILVNSDTVFHAD